MKVSWKKILEKIESVWIRVWHQEPSLREKTEKEKRPIHYIYEPRRGKRLCLGELKRYREDDTALWSTGR